MTASDPELRPRLPGEGVKKAPLSQRARRSLYKRQR